MDLVNLLQGYLRSDSSACSPIEKDDRAVALACAIFGGSLDIVESEPQADSGCETTLKQ